MVFTRAVAGSDGLQWKVLHEVGGVWLSAFCLSSFIQLKHVGENRAWRLEGFPW